AGAAAGSRTSSRRRAPSAVQVRKPCVSHAAETSASTTNSALASAVRVMAARARSGGARPALADQHAFANAARCATGVRRHDVGQRVAVEAAQEALQGLVDDAGQPAAPGERALVAC